jgi:hypothetical protein
MTRPVLAALLLALVACASEDPETYGYPPVETRYEITEAGVECRGTVDEEWAPTRHTCTWERVTVDAAPACYAHLVFERGDETSPWELVATFTSRATHCT